MSDRPTRRDIVFRAVGGGVALGAAAYGVDRLVEHGSGNATAVAHPKTAPEKPVELGVQPHTLPPRQFAWNDYEERDQYGNAVAPRFDRLMFFDVDGTPDAHAVRTLEASMRTLERRFLWSHKGLLFTVAWGPTYFTDIAKTKSPIPKPKGLSDFETPQLDHYHVCIHIASDDESRLRAIEAALVHGDKLPGVDGPVDLRGALKWRETRTGFTGTGLPAARQNVNGIPSGRPVSPKSPLFMGFASGLTKNQASEDGVAITEGPFADGTTMHVSHMRLRLTSWYDNLDQSERVARMYGPEVSVADVAKIKTDESGDPDHLDKDARTYGVVGHSQTSAKARRNGRAIIQRRDFNTIDGGEAGLHFVAVQHSIDDFVKTRKAMNCPSAQLINPAISDTTNNGINEFIFVTRRANYIIPSRLDRSFPQLAGRDAALA